MLDEPISWGNYCFELLKREENYYIKLTKEEVASIKAKLENPSITKWTSDFFPKANIINREFLNAIFSDKTKDWQYFKTNVADGYYTFSEPIFYRNNTFCLIYFEYASGWLLEKQGLRMYKKEDGKWVIWKYYCSDY